jgi:hypothetical protein
MDTKRREVLLRRKRFFVYSFVVRLIGMLFHREFHSMSNEQPYREEEEDWRQASSVNSNAFEQTKHLPFPSTLWYKIIQQLHYSLHSTIDFHSFINEFHSFMNLSELSFVLPVLIFWEFLIEIEGVLTVKVILIG